MLLFFSVANEIIHIDSFKNWSRDGWGNNSLKKDPNTNHWLFEHKTEKDFSITPINTYPGAVTPGQRYLLKGFFKYIPTNIQNSYIELSGVANNGRVQLTSSLCSTRFKNQLDTFTELSIIILVPNLCTSVQVRITGKGICNIEFYDLTLTELESYPNCNVQEFYSLSNSERPAKIVRIRLP